MEAWRQCDVLSRELMDESREVEPQITFHVANQTIQTHPMTRPGHAVSKLLEDVGNCRQITNQELSLHYLTDSLFTEQQKLRHVLDWAHSFLSSDSERLCGADSLILGDEKQRKTLRKSPVGSKEVTWPEYKEAPENMRSTKIQDATNEQTPSQDNTCETKCLFVSDQKQCAYSSDSDTNQTLASDSEAGFIMLDSRDISEHQMELNKAEVEVETNKEVWMGERKETVNEDQDYSSAFLRYTNNTLSNSKFEGAQEQMEKTSNLSFSCHFKIPPTLTVYEQYQLCVDQLHHLRVSQRQHIKPVKQTKASEETAAPGKAPSTPTAGIDLNSSTANPKTEKHFNKRFSSGEMTKERTSEVINKKRDRCTYNRNGATLTKQVLTKHCDNLTVEDKPAAVSAESRSITCNTHLELHSNTCGELMKGSAGGISSTDYAPTVKKTVGCTPNPGLFPKRHGRFKHCWNVKGPKKKTCGHKASLRLCEQSRVSLSSLNNEDILQRAQPSGVIKHRKRHTKEEKVKPTSVYRDSHNCLEPSRIHTPPGDLGPVSSALGVSRCEQSDCKYTPPGVPVCDHWLSLPDEVWLSILSLLPHSDVCRVLQVCRRLHTLAADHTLWKSVRIENSDLTDWWLLCVSRRRPRSLCLYSCSGLSLTSCGLEMSFTLCRKTLKELKVTSCTGPHLHGDRVLHLIGQLCEHVTSVDVSWSGATDTGVKALSDCCSGLQLKAIVLNGCHVTDDPLMKLIKRHKESLCRLEVFGCQFLTPSCLQTVYEMCPHLQHLNIGQVPKVNAHNLKVMTSQLKCLISLNLTGLQAVSDAILDTLLQSSVKLQSLTLSSCPRVSDLTLHSISKYTPCIRSLDVSGCKAVTDAGVQSLALGCGGLKQLDLSSTGAGNRGVTLLTNYCSKHLEIVKLSFCHITFESILKLCGNCKRLKVLHLYGCAHLPSDSDIRAVNATVKIYPQP